jgi:molecular chaperone DnaK (HSP70)
VQKTLTPVRKALRDAGVGPEDVKGVVLVGGATRMPAIRKAVGDFFGQQPLTNLDPDKLWRWARPCRPTCWPATMRRARIGCCST